VSTDRQTHTGLYYVDFVTLFIKSGPKAAKYT
jgi:hypothetical protein